MPNYLTLVLHVYPAKVSPRPVRLVNGLRPLTPSPAGFVANWHPAESVQGFPAGLAWARRKSRSQPRLTHPSPPSIKPFTPRPQDPNASHSQLTRSIPTLQYHVLAYTELPRQSLSRNRHPSASWSHPTGAQVCGTYTHSERRTPSPSRTLFQRS